MASATDGSGEVARGAGPPPGAVTALLEELALTPRHNAGSAWEAALSPGAVIGRFELVREIGRGGFGTVWEARDRELQRTVAFKALRVGARPELTEERLRAEAEAAARLAHPNIVTLHDVGRTAQGPYLVLELLRGRTLASRLADGPLPALEAVRVAAAVASGLAHAHAHGVVHRDLTPGNVFLCDDGQVKVLDLGMAHAFGRRKLDGGTAAYMAPEQARGAPEDERTDVFSLGVLLFQMLAGEMPFPEGAAPGRRAPALEVAVAPGLGPLVDRMLSLDPVDRPRNASAVLPTLETFRSELERTTHGTGAVVRRRRSRLRTGALLSAATLVGVVSTVVALRVSSRAPPSSPLSSIAVLPFVDLSAEHDQGYLSDGVAEEILNALTRIQALKVSGRTSSFSFKGRSDDLRTIGRMLGVQAILEGSVRKAGDRVRITAELVSVSDGYRLWAESFDRNVQDVLAVEDEIAAAVATALKMRLRLDRSTPPRTVNPEVHNQLLLGVHFLHRATEEDARRAKAALERALELDPSHAPSWANLALATFFVADSAETPAAIQAGYERAVAAAEKAIALDPDLAEGYAARGYLRDYVRWDWRGAREDLERALALNPGDGEAERRYATELGTIGRWKDALTAAQKATEIDPLSADAWATLGLMYWHGGQLERATFAYDRAVEITPENSFAWAYKVSLLVYEKRPAEALALADRTSEWYRLLLQSVAYHDLGEVERSQRALEELIQRYGHSAALQVAEAYAWRGDRERAFQWLDRAYAQHDSGMGRLKMLRLFEKLHEDPRWGALLRRLGLPEGD